MKRLVVLNKTYRPFSFTSPPNSIALIVLFVLYFGVFTKKCLFNYRSADMIFPRAMTMGLTDNTISYMYIMS